MTATKQASGFVVRCADFETKPFPTLERAEQFLAGIVKFDKCREAHEIVEVTDESA